MSFFKARRTERRSTPRGMTLAAPATLIAGLMMASCSGCHSTPTVTNNGANNGGSNTVSVEPTVRLYIMSDFAGALEPCGCTKDQLGGLDHAGAFIESEKAHAPRFGLVAAGPLFYMDPAPNPDHLAQDTTKAETIAASLKGLGFAAFAPGRNDWAGGTAELAKLTAASGGALLFGNTTPSSVGALPPGTAASVVRDFGGTKVGFIGMSAPDKDADATKVPSLDTTAPTDAVKAEWTKLHDQGVGITVLLASVGRGEAKRIADVVPGLTAIVVGSTGSAGDVNTPTPAAEEVGNVLITETGNHLTTIGVLDLFVRDGTSTFADGTGLELAQKRSELSTRIDELHVRIAAWELDGKIDKKDIEARKADLAKLEAERDALDRPKPPPGNQQSYFRFATKEVRDKMGRDPNTAAAMLAYYKQVNDANRIAFADRLPRSHDNKTPSYLGVDVCTNCHEDARAVWDKTTHAHAYKTLSDEFKEFNLDCVACHVTGYDQPGGSTVTHVDKLKDVQCEVCHGPGSKHGLDPDHVAMPVPKPGPDVCTGCHHSPHVENFDAKGKMAEILGPGHGRLLDGGALPQ